MVDDYPFVGDVRGRGHVPGDRAGQGQEDEGAAPAKVTERIFTECVQRGLLTMAYSAQLPASSRALTIDEATAMNGLAILEEVFDHMAREGYWRQ